MSETSGNKRQRQSLSRRIRNQMSGLVAIVLMLLLAIVAYLVSNNLNTQISNRLHVEVHSAHLQMEQRLNYLLENTERLTTNPFIVNGLVDAAGRQSYLPKLAENFASGRNVLSFLLVDYDARPLFQTVDEVPAYNESAELRSALAMAKHSLFIQQPDNHLVIVAPISYYDTTQGAVIVAFDLDAIAKRYILKSEGAFQRLRINDQVVGEYNYDPNMNYLEYRELSGPDTPLLQQLGLNIEIGLPKSSYLSPMVGDLIRLTIISLLFFAVVVLISNRIGKGIARPILTLHRRVMAMESSGESRCAPLGTDDELEELAEAFDLRTHQLSSTQEELKKDIAARITAQEELDHLRHYLQNIIDSMPSMLIGVDEEGTITHWNLQAEGYIGISADKAQGKNLASVVPMLSAQMEQVKQAIREHQPQHTPRHVHTQDGENRYTDITIYPLIANASVGAVIRVDDVTEQVRMEEMMMQTEKMMSVGGLAAGMAHEINNPLGGILQGMQNIRRRLSPQLKANQREAEALNIDLEAVQSYLEQRQILHFMDEIADAGKRASDIVANMLRFSRKAEMVLEAEDINSLIDRTLDLAAVDYDLKKKYDFREIEIIRDFDSRLQPVACIATEIQQVLLNLLRNAAQAMQRQTEREEKPRITVRSRSYGNTVRIEVEDNGPGMDEKVKARVFEPFFTTRPVGEGTGLGLSVSYFIVHDEHGGNMSVDSKPGKGTTFMINLPLQGPASPPQPPSMLE